MAAEVENVERIFQDVSNCSNVKSLEILSQDDVNVNYNLQLQKHKSHLEALKTKLVGLQTQSRFLETLAMENWSPTDSGKMQEHQAHTKDERKKDKQTIEELETEIEHLSKTLCTKQQMVKEKLARLEQRLSATRNKRKEYECLKAKSEEIAGKLKGKENTKGTIEEYKEKQLEAESAIKECKAAVSSLEHCKGLLQLEVSRLQDWVSGLQEELKTQETMKQSSDEQAEQHAQWLAGAIELYSNLGGMKVRSAQGDSIALEIPTSAARPEDQQDDSPLILTIKFRLEGGTQPVFAGAEVSSHSLFIDDLVNEAIQSGDVVGFTLQVKKRVKNQRTLIKEVEDLKRNYAMDWEPRDGRVRVMLGKSGKVICTLKVDPLYSEGRGHVTFLGVEGCSDKHHLQKLPTAGSGRSLTQWMKELHECFCNQ